MLKSFIVYFTVGFIVLCLIISYNQRNSEMVFVKAGDGNEYTVRNLPDKQVAADTLAELRRRMELLVQQMSSNPDVQDEFCSLQIEQLKDRFKPDKICESPSDSKYTSYSVDKGAKIFVCLRNKQTGEIADINTLTYVSIHELSHVMSSEVGPHRSVLEQFQVSVKASDGPRHLHIRRLLQEPDAILRDLHQQLCHRPCH